MAREDGSVIINTKVDTSGMTSGLNQIQGGIGKLGSGLKKLGGIIAGVFAVKEIVAFSKECIALGSDLDEVQNVVDVTFGKMSGAIEKFSKEAATQFGISELSAKQYTSTIGAMYKSMGFTEDAAAGMSIEMTKLAADMASFYNLDTDTAFNKIRSGISGETEPLKQLGINLSEVNLEEFRLAQGMEKSYKQMNQQEKALLRYNYLLSVTSDAQGDFARTSKSWANQTRILHLQLESIKADLGQGFIAALTPVLQVINKLLEGIAKLAASFKAFMRLITGTEDTEPTTSAAPAAVSTDDIGDAADAYTDAAEATQDYSDATDSVTKATKKAEKENKKYLSGLDEIHRYDEQIADAQDDIASGTAKPTGKTTTTTPGSAAATTALDQIDYGSLAKGETVVDELAQKMADLFKAIQEGVKPTVAALQRLWNEGLAQLGNFVWTALKDFYEHFLVPVGQWVFGEGLPRFIDALNNGLMKIDWDKINGGLVKLWDALAPFAINVGKGLLWFWENVLVPLGTWTMNEVVPRFLDTLSTAIRILNAVIEALKPLFQWFWDNLLLPIASWTGGIFLKVWDGINGALTTFAEWCEQNPETIRTITTIVASFFAAWAIVELAGKIPLLIGAIDSLLGAITGIITGAFNPWILVIGAIIAVGVLLWQNWDEIKAKALEIWGKVSDFLSGTWEFLKTTAVKKFNDIKDKIGGAWDTVKTKATNIWNSVSTFVSTTWNNLKTWAGEKFTAIKDGIGTAWDTVKEKTTNIWSSVSTTLSTKWSNFKTWAGDRFTSVKDSVKGAWDAVKTKTDTIWSNVSTTLSTKWTSFKTDASDKFGAIGTKVKDTWNDVKSWTTTKWGTIEEGVKGVWDGLSTAADTTFGAIGGFASGAWDTIKGGVGGFITWINDTFFDDWDEAWSSIVDAFGDIFDRLSGYLTAPVNAVIRLLNSMINTINSVLGGIENAFTFDFSWDNPITGTHHKWGYWLKLPRIPNIPELAQGAVIPPNSPFLATLGDQKSGTNVEAPLETIKEAVRDVVGNGTGDIHLTLNLDGKVIYDDVIRQARRQQQSNGYNPFQLA